MSTMIFDLECDGFLSEATTVHSLVIRDLASGEVFSCHDQPGGTHTIADGVEILSNADKIIGHNIIMFDIPVLQKLHGFELKRSVRDTLVLSRLFYPELHLIDTRRKMPLKLKGSHSLKAWGYRLRVYKGEFNETADWNHWSPEMQSYCEQDVNVTTELWRKLVPCLTKDQNKAVKIEHLFAQAITKQIKFGFPFDQKKAEVLLAELTQRKHELNDRLQEVFPPIEVEEEFIPKRDNKTKGYKAGVPFIKKRTVRFNPASRKQIGERLLTNGWQPEEFTETGQPKVSEAVLSQLDVPGAAELCDCLLVSKRIGQLCDGSNAWFRLVQPDGCIHGEVNTCGAVTGRCTHSRPNMAQVPNLGSAYGKECRELFHAPIGWSQVGVDASGLELRCLAHYLHPYDNGAYAKEILEGDIHATNQQAAGLATRNQAKTFIYAFLYGAGSEKLGSIVLPDGSKDDQVSAGSELKEKFLSNVPALKYLKESIDKDLEENKNYLRGIDGRMLKIRSEHAALNTLLQSAGAIVMKQATIEFFHTMEVVEELPHGDLWAQMAHVHDEFQLCCISELANAVALVGVESIKNAGETLGFRIRLDGEAKIGKNWSECH